MPVVCNRSAGLALVLSAAAMGGCGGSGDRPILRVPSPGAALSAPLRLGVVGDSYSNGEGVGVEAAWPNQLVARLARGRGPALRIVANPSVTGWTTEQALAEELPNVRAARPDVATVQLGVNDWVQGVPASVFRARFARVLREVVAITGAPGRVVAVTIPDFGVTSTGAQYGGGRNIAAGIAAFNRIVVSESRAAGIAVADVFALSQAMDDPALTAADGLHPSARELGLWARRIEPVVRRAWRSVASRR